MTALHGYCVNPPGAHGYHGLCPHTWDAVFGGQLTCSCDCHNETGDQ